MIVGVLVAAATPIISSASATPANIAGMVVFIDPGHNGANDASIGRQVPTGRGGTKNCQASGTSTNSGYPEHTFTWETGLRLRAALNALGVRTALSRGNDNALGPCVDERANMANALRPNAIVSLHADVMRPLADAGPTLIETLDAYLDCGGAIEACARKLFVHPNTVRYRLKRITDFTGRDPTQPRDAYVLRVAATVGQLNYPTPH